MIFKEAKFITSAANEKGFIEDVRPIVAICGKSNVGKSSFINMIAGKKQLAKTSGTPGRTRLVNYFDFGEIVLADLPGYGYARVSGDEKKRWAAMLESFFAKQGYVSHALLLADARHNPTADDITMAKFLYASLIPFTIVATKSDKLPKTRVKESCRKIAAALGTGEANVIPVSAVTGRGKEEVFSVFSGIAQKCTEQEETEEDF